MIKKYLTKENIIQILLLTQFILINIVDYFEFTQDGISAISFFGLIIGYFINITRKEV